MTTGILLTLVTGYAFVGSLFTFLVMVEKKYHYGADEYWKGYNAGLNERQSVR
jgi:hypothetical protein